MTFFVILIKKEDNNDNDFTKYAKYTIMKT